jgi:hypothetical protein
MKRLALIPLLLAASVTVAADPLPKVETASGSWNDLPRLESRDTSKLDSNVMQRIWEIAKERKCRIPGYVTGKLDLRVNFAVQYDPSGKLARVILPPLDCPAAEGLIAGTVIAMVQGGDFRRKGESPEGWYQGDLFFGFEAPA